MGGGAAMCVAFKVQRMGSGDCLKSPCMILPHHNPLGKR